nr:MAG TPA: hypothetical protein [Caudoviricetes sp.]
MTRTAAHLSALAPRAHARQIRPPAGRGRVSPFLCEQRTSKIPQKMERRTKNGPHHLPGM